MITLLADITPASALCLAFGLGGSIAAVYYLAVDAAPVVAVRRALETGRFDQHLNAVADVRYVHRYQPRHAAPKGDR